MSFMLFDTTICRNRIATNYNSMNENADIREDTGVCDTISSLAITSPPESTGVTTFVQEACTAVAAVDPSFSSTLYPVQTDLQDVREYFRRPVCIKAGDVPNSRGRFWVYNPSFNEVITNWAQGVNRLTGAYGIRAKIVLTLQISATPFHQGLVCMSGQYGYVNRIGVYDRGRDSCTSTNLPHVVLDLSSDTSVQLHMPFLFVAEYCSIKVNAQETKYCQFQLNNLSFVPSIAGMGPPTYQIFLHLEDIELFGATPQATRIISLNAGRKLSPVTEEFEKDTHPYSSALHAAGRTVSFIAKGVPSIASIGGPVAWALGKAAGVVRYFGYGKPAVTDPLMRIVRQDNVGEFNTDVATSCMVLAATAQNTTSINTAVGSTDVDEMSLSYIVSRWAQVNVFDYSTSSPPGTLLYATPINMLAFWFKSAGGLPAVNTVVSRFSSATSNSVQPSHLMFAASCFKQWRGGIKFRFTFAKTKMHAGRVMVAYNPYTQTRTNTITMTSTTNVTIPEYGTIGADPFGYSAIFDLKDGNVFEFKVPYVCPIPYSNTASDVGALALYVVNPLIASSVVSSTISVVVEVAGDSDFELSNPTGIMFPVHNAGTIRLNSGRVLSSDSEPVEDGILVEKSLSPTFVELCSFGVIVRQPPASLFLSIQTEENDIKVQAGRVVSEAPEVLNQMTMGESINSVKQLISMPGLAGIGYEAADVTIGEIVTPWYYQPTPSVLLPSPDVLLASRSFHYGGNWASCYSFLKGGTDLHVYSLTKSAFLTLTQVSSAGAYLPATGTPDQRSAGNAPFVFTGEYNFHIRLPAFFPTVRVNSWIANVLTAAGASWAGNNPWTSATSVTPYDSIQAVYSLRVRKNGSTSSFLPGVSIDINASDDAQLAMYIGPPPVYLPPLTTTQIFFDVDSVIAQTS